MTPQTTNQSSVCRCHACRCDHVTASSMMSSRREFKLTAHGYDKLTSHCRAARLLLPDHRGGGGAAYTTSDDAATYMLTNAGGGEAVSGEVSQLARAIERAEGCAWYWPGVGGDEAKCLLLDQPVGTFLLRDSSDNRFLFSVTVVTKYGPTSIRLVRVDNHFRFDSEYYDVTSGPHHHKHDDVGRTRLRCNCPVALILSYAGILMRNHSDGDHWKASSSSRGQFVCCWTTDQGGRREIPMRLGRPLARPRTLAELSRARLNNHLRLWDNQDRIEGLPLPPLLRDYVSRYPYPV